MEFQDYYATLGIARDATADQVKRAFRRLARKHHPDLNAGDRAAEERFKAINEAYEVLGDADTRRKYDELGANWKLYEQAQAAGRDPFAGAGPAAGGGRGTRVRTMSEDDVRRLFGDERFSDFFRTFFGAETRWTGRDGWHAGPDVERELELTLEQAFGGVTRRITVRDGGSTRTLDVRVPPGVDDGSRVRVPGARLAARGGSPSADLYLRVRIAPHEVYTRKGRDLHMRGAVPAHLPAVLGGRGRPAHDRRRQRDAEGAPGHAAGPGLPRQGARHAGASRRSPGRPLCDRGRPDSRFVDPGGTAALRSAGGAGGRRPGRRSDAGSRRGIGSARRRRTPAPAPARPGHCQRNADFSRPVATNSPRLDLRCGVARWNGCGCPVGDRGPCYRRRDCPVLAARSAVPRPGAGRGSRP